MRFTSLLLAVCVTLRALAAPVPVVETSHFELDNAVGHNQTLSNHHSFPSLDHLSPPSHVNAVVFNELSASHRHDEKRRDHLPIDHSTEIVPRSTLNKPTSSSASQSNQPKPTSSTTPRPRKPKRKSTGSTINQAKESGPQSQLVGVASVEEMKKALLIEPDKSLFYCGNSRPFRGPAEQRAEKTGEMTLDMAWTDRALPEAAKRFKKKRRDLFWNNASQAFAELSSGTVHVLLEDSVRIESFDQTSVWARIEWPALKANPRVTRIVKVTQAGAEEPLFDRAHSSSP